MNFNTKGSTKIHIMNINKKVITALTVSVITITSLAGCSSTATKATPAAKPTASASAAPTKTASADEVKAKTVKDTMATAGGTFSPCQQWVPIGASSGTPTYTKGAACLLLPDYTAFKTPNGDPIVCDPIANGDAALGIIYTGSEFKCTYTIPVAGQ